MQREICWIVPICAECNSPLNDKRMQNSEGNHSRIRVGCLVVKTKYTFEMRTAQRRIAMDCTYENDSGYYTDDYELMENDSFSNGSGGGWGHSGGGQHTFSDVCARVVSIPKIPTSRGVETATTAEGNNLLGFITVIKINSYDLH